MAVATAIESPEAGAGSNQVEGRDTVIAPQPATKLAFGSAPVDLLKFFGLRQQPFDVTPDPAYLFPSESHSNALVHLKRGIDHFRGFLALVAEPGMGKTTVLNRLMDDLADSARVICLFQTQCTSRELLAYILNELEVDHTGMDVVAMHRALNQALLEEMLRGRRFVLVVDEAQNLQGPVLETIRLLSDFETSNSKLIQIVLAGQPELADTLLTPELTQLRQRIAVIARLNALSPVETAEYIEFRLRSAGWQDTMLFSSDALDRIAELSGGVPRRINHLCFGTLLEAFHRGVRVIEADLVNEIAGGLDLAAVARNSKPAAAVPGTERAEAFDASGLAKLLAATLAAQSQEAAEAAAREKQGAVLRGTLTEKVRRQGWGKQHECRILVSLERDAASGVSVAERYYCASLYVDEAQASALEVNKPVRIRIEQD